MPDNTILRRTPLTLDARIAFPDGEDAVPFVLSDNGCHWTPVRKTDADELRELLGRQPLFVMVDDRLVPDGLLVAPARDWSLAPLDEVDWPIGQDRPSGTGMHLGSATGTITFDMGDAMMAFDQFSGSLAKLADAFTNMMTKEMTALDMDTPADTGTLAPSRHERRKAAAIARGKSDKPRPDRQVLRWQRGW